MEHPDSNVVASGVGLNKFNNTSRFRVERFLAKRIKGLYKNKVISLDKDFVNNACGRLWQGGTFWFLLKIINYLNMNKKTGANILFIYPNTYGMYMLPPAIAMFSSILKKEGHQVRIFDTTYYSIDNMFDFVGNRDEMI